MIKVTAVITDEKVTVEYGIDEPLTVEQLAALMVKLFEDTLGENPTPMELVGVQRAMAEALSNA